MSIGGTVTTWWFRICACSYSRPVPSRGDTHHPRTRNSCLCSPATVGRGVGSLDVGFGSDLDAAPPFERFFPPSVGEQFRQIFDFLNLALAQSSRRQNDECALLMSESGKGGLTLRQAWYCLYEDPQRSSRSRLCSWMALLRLSRSLMPAGVSDGFESGGAMSKRYDLSQWLKHVS